MKTSYTRILAFATVLLSGACANAEGVAQQMQQQQYQQQYQQQQYQYQQQYQTPQYVPQDNDETYRLPGQYSPTLNELRKQFPVQQVPQQAPQYQQYDQNDNTQGHSSYYYQ